jgi:hypothetical protein
MDERQSIKKERKCPLLIATFQSETSSEGVVLSSMIIDFRNV